MTNTDFLRERLLNRCGMTQYAQVMDKPDTRALSELRDACWSKDFETKMRNRLVLGAMRYGRIDRQAVDHRRGVASMRRRLDDYMANGNSENLVDIANLCLMLYVGGDHPTQHFATGDGVEHC